VSSANRRSEEATCSSREQQPSGFGRYTNGDTLYSFQGFDSVERKESEFAGRSPIVTRAHVCMNQHAEIVQIQKVITIHTERHESKEAQEVQRDRTSVVHRRGHRRTGQYLCGRTASRWRHQVLEGGIDR
jgi:hypothetical protein